MQYTLFGLSMAGSVVLIADGFFNPTQRGGQLRASASQLESSIWRFRTRVGSFAVPQGNLQPKQPDYALRDAMTAWHEEQTAGTDQLATALDKTYAPKVYTHLQYAGALPSRRAGRAREGRRPHRISARRRRSSGSTRSSTAGHVLCRLGVSGAAGREAAMPSWTTRRAAQCRPHRSSRRGLAPPSMATGLSSLVGSTTAKVAPSGGGPLTAARMAR